MKALATAPSTWSLAAERLMTRLEMTASTDSSGRGMSSTVPERELDVLDACPGLAPPGELGHLGRHAEAGPARCRPAAPGQSTAAAYPFMAPLPAPTHMKTTRSPSLTRPARRSSSSMIRVLAAEVLP